MFDRPNAGELAVILIALIVAIMGGSARLVYEWKPIKPLMRWVTNMIVSVFAATIIGLLTWEWLSGTRPAIWAAMCGISAWIGGDIVDRIARRMVKAIDKFVTVETKPDDH